MEKEIDGSIYRISIGPCFDHPAEGGLKLTFSQNQCAIYDLAFTIIPWKTIDSTASRVLLVANLQGASGKINDIRRAMEACNRIAPPYVLVNAAELITAALHINVIVGVSNEQHLWKANQWSPYFAFDYDEFWKSFPSTRSDIGLYEMSIPIPIKPLETVETSAARAIRKRELGAVLCAVQQVRFTVREKPIDAGMKLHHNRKSIRCDNLFSRL